MPETVVVPYHRLEMYPKQRDAIASGHQYAMIAAATKTGKTAGCIQWLLDETLSERRKEGDNTWWIAPYYRQAKMAYNRVWRGIKPLIDMGFAKKHDTDLKIEFSGYATMWFKSGDNPDTLYGDDVHAIVIDEATRARAGTWDAARSVTFAVNGKVRIIYNVKGRLNWCYALSQKILSGAMGNDWKYSTITAYDAAEAGIVSLELLEQIKAEYADRMEVFEELYLCIPSDSGSSPIGVDAIRRQKFDHALPHTRPVQMGVDLARKQDYTVITGLDANGYVCTFRRERGMQWKDQIEMIITEARQMPPGSVLVIDGSGVGDGIVPFVESGLKDARITVKPYVFSVSTKPQLVDCLAATIQQGKVWFPEGIITDELMSLEYNTRIKDGKVTGVTYEVPPGMTDDCIMSLGLATLAPRYKDEKRVPRRLVAV